MAKVAWWQRQYLSVQVNLAISCNLAVVAKVNHEWIGRHQICPLELHANLNLVVPTISILECSRVTEAAVRQKAFRVAFFSFEGIRL